jgi:hypothetical protein
LEFSFAPSGLEFILFVDPGRRSFHFAGPGLFSIGLSALSVYELAQEVAYRYNPVMSPSPSGILQIDDSRRESVQGLLMSLNMLIEFGDAFDYSGADFRKWCGEVGFKRFEVIHLAGPSSAAVAYK